MACQSTSAGAKSGKSRGPLVTVSMPTAADSPAVHAVGRVTPASAAGAWPLARIDLGLVWSKAVPPMRRGPWYSSGRRAKISPKAITSLERSSNWI
eukprot:3667047-Prymnesium_polylepis.1